MVLGIKLGFCPNQVTGGGLSLAKKFFCGRIGKNPPPLPRKAPGSDGFCDWGSGPLGVGNVLEPYMLLYTPPLFTRSLSTTRL